VEVMNPGFGSGFSREKTRRIFLSNRSASRFGMLCICASAPQKSRKH